MPTQPRNPAAIAVAIAIAICAALCAAANADAATRFAAPGGTGIAPCADQAKPCSIFTAADESAGAAVGDEVVLAPGVYSDTAGDLGPRGLVSLAQGVRLHGAGGQSRPVIRLEQSSGLGEAFGAFLVRQGDTVSHLEIDTAVAQTNLSINGGIVEDLIARSRTEGNRAFACLQTAGMLRDSACLSSGSEAVAVGLGGSFPAGTAIQAQLRNVTAVSTGTDSLGLRAEVSGAVSFDVSAVGLIAAGTASDVFVAGLSLGPHIPGTGARVRVNLHHSNYATAGTRTDAGGGTATVTLPGSPTNVMEPPLLAADGYHQLPGSPTVEAGATDEFSGAADLDGQLRTIGAEADIGADEQARATTTEVTCTPNAMTLGVGSTRCTVTVTDKGAGGFAPTGTVAFATTSTGTFTPATCELPSAIGSRAACGIAYTPSPLVAGTHSIEAAYAGDQTRDPSRGSTPVTVAAPGSGGGDQGGPEPVSPPVTTIGTRPAKTTRIAVAKLTFSSDQIGSRFECGLDGGAFRRCVSPLRKKVRPGRHVFRVRAVNPAGAPDPTPALCRWRVLGR